MIKVEDIISTNSKLSTWNLIYKYFDIKWKIRLFFVLIFSLIFFIFSLIFFIFGFYSFHVNIFLAIIFCIIGIILARYFLNFSDKKKKIIIKLKYKYAHLEFEKFNRKTILKIQEEEFKKLLNIKNSLNKENISFLIECIKRDNKNNIFNHYFMTNFICIATSIYFGNLISGYANFFINAKDVKDFLFLYKVLVVILVFLFSMYFYFEIIIFRDIIVSIRKNRNRPIRILENIYLEKYT